MIPADWQEVSVLEDRQAHLRWLSQRRLSRVRTFAVPFAVRVLTSRFIGPAVVGAVLVESGLYFAVGHDGGAQILGPALLASGLVGAIAVWALVIFDQQQTDRETQLRLAVGEPMSDRSFERIDLTACVLTGWTATDASFRNARLMGVDLSGAQLQSSNFSGAMAGYANFSESDLTMVQADHAEFSMASFASADMRSGQFTFADLRNADLSGADLRNADFSGADLRGADIRGAKTMGTRFDGAISSAETRWPTSFRAETTREQRGLDELGSADGYLAAIDLRSHRLALGAIAAVFVVVAAVSAGKALGGESESPATKVLSETQTQIAYRVTGSVAIAKVQLTNEHNGTEESEVITPFQRLLEVPTGYELRLVVEARGTGDVSCSIEDSSGVLSEATVIGPGSRAVCEAISG